MESKKRICFFGCFDGAGTESATFLVANELCDKYSVHIVNCKENAPYFPLDERITFSNLKCKALSGFKGEFILRRNFEFRRYLRKNKIDVVISIEAITGIFSLLPARLAGCKHIVWEHANYYHDFGVSWIQKMRSLDLKLADAYVVLTKRDRKNFQEHFRIKKPLVQIYNIAQADSEKIQYNMSSKTIISAGHLNKRKNFGIVPDVARIVFEKYPDWNWKIYGSGEEEEAIQEKIRRFGLEKNVFLCGRTKDMESVYNEGSLFVMTSLKEGLPMVLLEAKADKLPLVSFDIETGPDEIIRDGVNGFLIPPYDVDVMASRIMDLISDSTKRQAFSHASLLDLEQFDAKRIGSQWYDLIESL